MILLCQNPQLPCVFTHTSEINKNTIFSLSAKFLFTDTDSLCYEIETDDFYEDIKEDCDAWFDTSNFPKDHLSGIQGNKNKKVPGKFKDEAGGKIIEEFVGLIKSKTLFY